ncbi:hypothetical protein BGI41_06500 [Methanobrevibacter sp. 87.7]|uniref:DUF2098 family protein n=1 Tax=Methanobrevibacter sp. 87.7 TaxID=387957 RepID=UPI000B5107CF|nr:DUF2098 family protein [Methanobrevibacter sp. 87.7]OWT32669.1 hypothetical protein BGI41_06500 [Methanobrevibacter sp. 87.7]
MDVKDALENTIEVGDHVVYVPTGTNGEIEDIRIKDEKYWVKIKGTGMWYVTSKVELLADNEFEDKEEYKELEKDNTDEDIERIKQRKDDMSNFELQDEVAEGGG